MRTTLNPHNNDEVVRKRREIVEDCLSSGIEDFSTISQRWIAAGIVAPDGEPYAEPTLSNDKKIVRDRFAKYSADKYELLVGDVISKQKKIFRKAFESGDYIAALNALKGIREVLDIDKPKGSRALKRAADERLVNTGKGGMTEAESENKAVQIALDNSPAILGEMLKVMKEIGALDAATMTETEMQENAKRLAQSDSENDLLPASNSGLTLNGNGNGMHK